MHCILFQGIPLRVFEDNGIVVRIEFVEKCVSRADKSMQRKLISFWKGNKDSIKYTFNVKEQLKIIYRKAQEIPFGKVASYCDISRSIFGDTSYSRFVGYAMHVNPLPIIVPCHRVIKGDGKLGGFGSGLKNKVRLLEAEGVKIENGRVASVYFARL
jgi:methylated-DNA-[protein]-cysteine S-methyltransferase